MSNKNTSNPVLTEVKRAQDNVSETARKAWLASLGTVRSVEEEGGRIFDRLVDRGRKVETTGQKRFDEVRNRVDSALSDLGTQVERQVANTLNRFGVPTRDEVETLNRRLEKLSVLVDRLLENQQAIKADATTKVTSKATPKAKVATKAKVAVKVEAPAVEELPRKVYHVSSHDDGWKIQAEGSTAPVKAVGTKNEALSAARDIARDNEPSQVVVHRLDGTIQTHYTYGE